MRVLTVLNWLARAGLEVQLLRSLDGFQNSGIQVDICCTAPKRELDEDFERMGCRIFRIPKHLNCYATAKRIENLVSIHHFDLVHSQFGHTSGGIALGANRRGLPMIVSIHSSMALSLQDWINRPILHHLRRLWLQWHQALMNRYVSVFVGHSETNLNNFCSTWKHDPKRYRLIRNAIEFPQAKLDKAENRQRLGVPRDTLVLLHVGGFRKEKNHSGLLEIVRRFGEKRDNVLLLLVGEGNLLQEVRCEVQAMGLSGRVRFEGSQGNVWSYYAAADVFVFPSISEGFGNALVESQSACLPIVASDIPAHRESVALPQHRFLFPSYDYDMAADYVLQQVEAASERRNHWVAESNNYVRSHFSIDRMVGEFVGLYRSFR